MKISTLDGEFFILNGLPYKINDHSYTFLSERFDIVNKYTGISLLTRGSHYSNVEVNTIFYNTIEDFGLAIIPVFTTRKVV
jgi:hypothetical protein